MSHAGGVRADGVRAEVWDDTRILPAGSDLVGIDRFPPTVAAEPPFPLSRRGHERGNCRGDGQTAAREFGEGVEGERGGVGESVLQQVPARCERRRGVADTNGGDFGTEGNTAENGLEGRGDHTDPDPHSRYRNRYCLWKCACGEGSGGGVPANDLPAVVSWFSPVP